MKKLSLALSAFVVMLLFTLQSCDKMTDNGQLDGMWQFMEVSYAHEGEYTSTVNTKSYKAYLAFQLDLAKITWMYAPIVGASNTVLCRFDHKGNTLRLYNFYYNFTDRDSLITDPGTMLLAPIGIKGNDTVFIIKEENAHTLILQNEYARIVLRKF